MGNKCTLGGHGKISKKRHLMALQLLQDFQAYCQLIAQENSAVAVCCQRDLETPAVASISTG